MAKKSVKDKASSEITVAIAMALHELSQEMHDVENTVLTFGAQGRVYSPWSSKIYGLRQMPNRR